MNPLRLTCLALLAAGSVASALTINLDYTYDVNDEFSGGSFFTDHPTAKATLQQAAADLGAAIKPSLGAVTTDVFTGTNGSTQAKIDWSLDFTNPVTNATVTLNTFTFAADTVTIYVGMQKLSGNTLGQGGPGGAGIGTSFSGFTSELPVAMSKAETASNAMMPRSGGPSMGTISGSLSGASYSVSYGATVGNLWFDNDTDNNGAIDSESTLDNFWHFELTSPTVDGQNDFYSVALHELMHSIGFGTSDTWTSKHSGTTWTGSNAIALNGGSGANLVSSDGAHIAEGVMSPRLSDSVMQEVVMDPSLTQGTRKTLTQMDLAFLRDLQYVTVPEPSTAALLATALALGLTSRRTSRRPAPCAGKSCRRS